MLMIREHEEHDTQCATKTKAARLARIETQRTGIPHTHYLITTWRNLEPRICWTVIPTCRALIRLRTTDTDITT